jgi:dynamin GTPase
MKIFFNLNKIYKFVKLSDLATSDALQLAKEADPEGERTIGVLTKMDLMDEGTNARDILDGKLLPLRRGYIGVINRSQKDIDSKKNIAEALASERKFFSDHSDYWEISDRLGTSYLQKYLNKELSGHIFKQLPSLRDMFESKLNALEERLETFSVPEETKDFDKILSETNEQLRREFELSIGRSASVKVDIKNLTGGTRINSLMNEKYPNEITAMFYDENKLRREIAVSIQNIHGAYLGIFTPDMAFEACIRNQIGIYISFSNKIFRKLFFT